MIPFAMVLLSHPPGPLTLNLTSPVWENCFVQVLSNPIQPEFFEFPRFCGIICKTERKGVSDSSKCSVFRIWTD